MPARGYYHHIIFGSLAMLNVGVMLALVLVEKMSTLMRVLIVISMAMGFTAAILSQSRGVWLVIPVYVLVAMAVTWQQSRKRFTLIVIFISICVVAAALSPLGKLVEQRVQTAADEVSTYYERDNYATSVGQRLVMWGLAVDLWKENPFIGIGPGDFDDHIIELQEQGRFKGMEVHASTHNIYMQALVNAGLLGIAALLLSLFLLPMRQLLKYGHRDRTIMLVGINTLTLFAVIGISESWTLRLPTVSVYIIYMIVILTSLTTMTDTEPEYI
jgi:O-antigen ligase